MQKKRDYLISKRLMYRTHCMFCRKKLNMNIRRNLFWNDYMYLFNIYGVVVGKDAVHCNDCSYVMNHVLKGNLITQYFEIKDTSNMTLFKCVNEILCMKESCKQIDIHLFQKKTPLKHYSIENWQNISNRDYYTIVGLSKKEYMKVYTFIMKQIKKVCM